MQITISKMTFKPAVLPAKEGVSAPPLSPLHASMLAAQQQLSHVPASGPAVFRKVPINQRQPDGSVVAF